MSAMKMGDAMRVLDRLASKTVKKSETDSSRLVVEMTALGAVLLELDVATAPPKVRRFTFLELDPSLTETEKKNAFLNFLTPFKRGDLPKTTLCWSEGMTFRQLSLPDMPPEDLIKAVVWDLKKKYFFNPEENLLGYKDVMDVEGPEGPEKLFNIFYCENKTALPRLNFAQGLGLEVDSLYPGPVALAAFAHASGQCPSGKDLILCDLSEAAARILVVRDDRVMLVRNITLGVSEGVWPDEVLARIADELHKTVEFYESQKFSRPVEKVLFTGAGPEPSRFLDFMAPKLGLPASFPDLAPFLSGHLREEEKQALLSHAGLLFTALGAAFVPDGTLNLVPSDIKTRNLQRKVQRWLTMGLIFFGAFLALVTGLTAFNTQLVKARLTTLAVESAKIGESKKEFEALLARERVRRAALKGDVPAAALLKDIAARMPAEAALSELHYSRQEGSLALTGLVPASRESSKTVTQFTENLAGSAFLSSAQTGGTEQDEENKAVRFEISGTVKGLV